MGSEMCIRDSFLVALFLPGALFAALLASPFFAALIFAATLVSALGVPSGEIAETTCFCSSASRLNALSSLCLDCEIAFSAESSDWL